MGNQTSKYNSKDKSKKNVHWKSAGNIVWNLLSMNEKICEKVKENW